MATSQPFPMAGPTQAYTTPPNSQPGTQTFAPPQYSPLHASSANQSPTAQSAPNFPNLPLATRALRSPKSPMFIPAALRPTERPTDRTPRASPLTPPRSVHGSTDSLVNHTAGRPVSRRSTTDSRKQKSRAFTSMPEDEQNVTQEYNDLCSVTGPPTRDHWKSDTNAPICDHPICHKSFGLFERRHHCRHCGNVFCNEHSARQIPLDQDANFNPKGATWRACEHCWDQFDLWKIERSSNRSDEGGRAETPHTPIKLIGREGKSPEGQKGAVASSVTRDYNWSTF